MVLKLNTYDGFFTSAPFKFYTVEENDNPDIEKIYYLGEELDLNDPKSYDLAINFLNDCKEHDCEIYDTCIFGVLDTLLGESFKKIYDAMNDEIDSFIGLLTRTKTELLKRNESTKCCEACKEVEKKTDTTKRVEPVSNTMTFELARKYIETVMDPASELPDADYNVILTTLTNYGNWVLKQ